MKIKKLIFLVALATSSSCSLQPQPGQLIGTSVSKVSTNYKEVDLDWSNSVFVHNNYSITIPEKWGFGLLGKKEKFMEIDPHDIEFKYSLKECRYHSAESTYQTSFDELIERSPSSYKQMFEIDVSKINIDDYILVKGELIDDRYFRYDWNDSYYNACYFKLKNDQINDIKNKRFNQINVKLKILKHFDNELSFFTQERDGLINVAEFSDVSTIFNPALV